MAAFRPTLLLAAALLGLSACATKPPASDAEALAEYQQTDDPLEPTNRVFFAVNNGIDTVILRPIALGYRYAVPEFIRNPIHNVIANLSFPVLFANDILQTNPRRAGDTFMRFLINSTVGVAGIFDVASGWGYPQHDTDFGVTLALWGLPSGPFLFLPVLGPSNPRDATGFGVDIGLDPVTYLTGSTATTFQWTRFGVSAIDQRERVLDATDQINKQALDPYATYRSLYRQHRESQIEDTRSDNRQTVPDWFSH
jgi:phospholipid-binding lipoprotein MlaA